MTIFKGIDSQGNVIEEQSYNNDLPSDMVPMVLRRFVNYPYVIKVTISKNQDTPIAYDAIKCQWCWVMSYEKTKYCPACGHINPLWI